MNRIRNVIYRVGLILFFCAVFMLIPPIRHTMTFIVTFMVEFSKCMFYMLETFKHL